jgi:hypothetical protein
VTRGIRYAFLPFIYDQDAAKIRDANQAFVAQDPGEQAQLLSNHRR